MSPGLWLTTGLRLWGAVFRTIGRAMEQEQYDVLREDIRGDYDTWVAENNKRVMKRAGVATGIGLSIIALITGLSLGIKRV